MYKPKAFFPYLCAILYLLNLTWPSPPEISHSVFWTACPVTSRRGDFTAAIQFSSDESLNRTVKATSRSYSSISEKTNTACQCHLRAQYHTWSLQKPCSANWFVSLSACLHSTGQLGRAPSQEPQHSHRSPAAAFGKLHLHQLGWKINLRNRSWWATKYLLILRVSYSTAAWASS